MIKAIDTHYKGYRFRSRLEARWAVFFDGIQAQWSYESEGYLLNKFIFEDDPYLPDFFLYFNPEHKEFHSNYSNPGAWVEIKGSEPEPLEIMKIRALSAQTKHNGILLVDVPGSHKLYRCHYSGIGGWFKRDDWLSEDILFAQFGRYARNDKYNAAMKAARSARFEYGESPDVQL